MDPNPTAGVPTRGGELGHGAQTEREDRRVSVEAGTKVNASVNQAMPGVAGTPQKVGEAGDGFFPRNFGGNAACRRRDFRLRAFTAVTE